MREEISGRSHETRILAKLLGSSEPELLAVYGRRRVGKTFLVRKCLESEAVYFEIAGQSDAALAIQLENFAEAFSRTFLEDYRIAAPASWNEALRILAAEIDKRAPRGKVVLFFDELPWLASRKSGFLQAFDHFWNTWATRKRNILVVVCGSAASWMIKRLLDHRGGLHNRVTAQIRLLPFTLAETEAYFRDRNILLDRRQILDIYMATGGVPHYLRRIEKGQSAAQNIDRLCFTKDGILSGEFNRLYSSLFENEGAYIDVIRALARKRSGIPRTELLAMAKISTGGTASRILTALEESGFIARTVPFGKSSREAVYRLVDEYSLFYLTWMQRAPSQDISSTSPGYWMLQQGKQRLSSWSGYAFEGICQKHVWQIKKALGIHGVATSESAWFYSPSSKEERGTQIDLLIDRADNCISLCEMKCSQREFVITKSYAETLRRKLSIFKEKTGTRKTVFIVMVTVHGVKANAYCDELCSAQVILDDLFEPSHRW